MTAPMTVGIDYGSVDENAPPALGTLASACAAVGSHLGFAIVRGAWGAWKDPVLARDWAALGAAGLTRAAYLYLRRAEAGASPEDQVDVLIGALSETSWPHSHGAGDMVPVLDVEDDSPAAAPAAELAWVYRAWTRLHDRVGASPVIYTSARVWREVLGDPTVADPRVARMTASPLWLAKPWPLAVGQPADLSPARFAGGQLDPEVPAPWGADDWWMHQYQGDARPVPGVSHQADLSRFRAVAQGDHGRRVSWIQQRVGAVTDGQFGPATDAAVRAFQGRSKLTVDGVVGVRTFAELTWAASP